MSYPPYPDPADPSQQGGFGQPGGHPQPGANPYAQPGQNPYANPYAQPGQNPYAPQAGNPYAPQAGNPYAQPGQNPYAQPGQNPYAPQAGNPYAQPGQNPYANPYAPQGGPGNYAHWGLRVGAYLIDVLILAPFYIIAGIIGAVGTEPDQTVPFPDGTAYTVPGAPAAWAVIVSIILYLGAAAVAIWNLAFRQGKTGQSIGKGVLKIKLINEETGQPLGPGLAFARIFVHIVDGLPCYLGYLWPLWDQKRQTFADKILKTIVVKV